jgi:hypothetical protein
LLKTRLHCRADVCYRGTTIPSKGPIPLAFFTRVSPSAMARTEKREQKTRVETAPMSVNGPRATGLSLLYFFQKKDGEREEKQETAPTQQRKRNDKNDNRAAASRRRRLYDKSPG